MYFPDLRFYPPQKGHLKGGAVPQWPLKFYLFDSVIRPGRAFLRRLIDLTVGVCLPNHYIRLNREVKEDLKTWLYMSFLSNFNGRLMAQFLQTKSFY